MSSHQRREESRKKLLDTAIELLDEYDNPEKITVRLIAERAGVGMGMINYHFTSRDNLIFYAAMEQLNKVAEKYSGIESSGNNVVGNLKSLVKAICDVVIKNKKLSKIALEYELQNEEFGICLFLLPMLNQIFGKEKSEGEIKFIAIQILLPLQMAFLREDAIRHYMDLDINDKEKRDIVIEKAIDNIVGKSLNC